MSTYYSIQSKEKWKKAKELGVLRADEDWIDEDWIHSYKWMQKQMMNRIQCGDLPIWLWTEKPDSTANAWGTPGESFVLLSIELPKKNVLLSDFDAWHSVLNNWFLAFDERESLAWKKGESALTKEKSWERIFDLDDCATSELWGGEQVIQGVTGNISIKHISVLSTFKAI